MAGLSLLGTGVLGVSGAPSGLSIGDGSAVVGDAQSAPGVSGFSVSNFGVQGQSKNSTGVIGITEGNASAGVIGVDESSTGGFGLSGLSFTAGGVGVNADNTVGTALQVTGVAKSPAERCGLPPPPARARRPTPA